MPNRGLQARSLAVLAVLIVAVGVVFEGTSSDSASVANPSPNTGASPAQPSSASPVFPILVVSSGSMCQRLANPAINKCTLAIGDIIVIRNQDPSTILPSCADFTCTSPPNGTIIVFRPPGPFSNDPNFLVVHRVVAVRLTSQGYFFYTRGDANGGSCYCQSANDAWDTTSGGVPASNVVGVYQYTIPIPYLGLIILAIQKLLSSGPPFS